MTSDVIDIFQASRQNYGTSKIKVELKKRGLIVPDDELDALCKNRVLSLPIP